MKLSSLVGLTVISLDSGRAIGEIKKLLLDADPKKVEFIVIDIYEDKRDGFAVHLFRYGDLQGIGDVAVTVGSLDQVRTISSETLYHQVFADQISIFGSRVISHVGNDLGTLKDFVFDSESAVIQAIVLEEAGQLYYYKAEPYLLISEKCLVLNPDQLITAEEYNYYSAGEGSSLSDNLNTQPVEEPGAPRAPTAPFPGYPVGGQDPATGVPDAYRPVDVVDDSGGGFQLPRRFVQNVPGPLGSQGQGPIAGPRPAPFMQTPQRSFQQHIPGSDDYSQSVTGVGGPGLPPMNIYDLAEPKVPEMPATQKRAGGLFFRRGEKKPKPAPPPKQRETPPQAEETMNDQDMLDAMKGFMKS